MVAPSGKVKPETLLETPARFSTQSMVIGKVADDELVENAVNNAGNIALKCLVGETPARNRKMAGRNSKRCAAKANITVTKNRANGSNASTPDIRTTFDTKA